MRFVISFIITMSFAATLPAFAEMPLASPQGANKDSAMHNAEGIAAYNEGKFSSAAVHFMEAAKIDPKSAEAHFNLALALHNQGKHRDATEHFKAAKQLAPNNKAIAGSETLNAHVKM